MYSTLDFLVRLNARRFIVGASPELKFRTTDEAYTAHVVASYRQLASRDISFLPISFKSTHSLRPMRARGTAYFEFFFYFVITYGSCKKRKYYDRTSEK